MKTKVLGLCLAGVLGLSGCATADRGQFADVATTAIGFNLNYIEGNPLFQGMDILPIAVIKLSITQGMKYTPDYICTPGLWSLGTVGYGLSLWNIGVIAGSGPIGLGVFGALLLWKYDDWYKSAEITCHNVEEFVPFNYDIGFIDKN